MHKWLDCGYCHLVNAFEVESVLNCSLIVQSRLNDYMERGIDISNGTRIRAVILLKGGNVYLSSTSPETLKRRLLED